MGICFSQPTYVENHRQLLGCCVMITEKTKLESSSLQKQWLSRSAFKNSLLDRHRYEVSDQLQSTNVSDNVLTYRTKHKLVIHTGVDLTECEERNVFVYSDDQIRREVSTTATAKVSRNELVPIVEAEISRRRLETPGKRSHYVVATVSNFELAIIPCEHKKRGYAVTPLELDSKQQIIRNENGDGFITRVLYGGYVIVETDEKNVGPIAQSLSGGVKVSLQSGAAAHCSLDKTAGAKIFESWVKVVGGSQSAIPVSFTGPVSELVCAVEKWTKGLLRNPKESKAIAVCFVPYTSLSLSPAEEAKAVFEYMSENFGWGPMSNRCTKQKGDLLEHTSAVEALHNLIKESKFSIEDFLKEHPPPFKVREKYLLNGLEVTPAMYVTNLLAEKNGEPEERTDPSEKKNEERTDPSDTQTSADPVHPVQHIEPAVEVKPKKDEGRTTPNEPIHELKGPKPVPVPQVDEKELSKHMEKYGWGGTQKLALGGDPKHPNVLQRLLEKIRRSGQSIESFLAAHPPPAKDGRVFVLRVGKKAVRLTPAAYVSGLEAATDSDDCDGDGSS